MRRAITDLSPGAHFSGRLDARGALPPELAALINGSKQQGPEKSWGKFLEVHHRLFLRVAHTVGADYDAAMDHYAHVLEQLRADDFKRLRAYVPDGQTKFTTWLVVVAQRLCLDYHRRLYGRFRREDPDGGTVEGSRSTRRRLVDLLFHEINTLTMAADASATPDRDLQRKQLLAALQAALDVLGVEDRLILKLRYVDDVPVREVATLLEMPTVFHLYRRIDKILKRLRGMLHDRGIDDSQP